MDPEIPLRELKKAKNKIALYEAALSLMKDRMFSQVMLEDICKRAEISKVTFFKFYQRKEDLLIYFMRIWLTERVIEIDTEGKKGFQAFRHLLTQVAKEHQVRPGMMPSLISFLAEQNMQPCMPELSPAEVSLLFPGHEEAGSRSPNMYDLFQQFMKDEDQAGRLNKALTLEQAVQICFTTFYGAFLTAQLYNSTEIGCFYETHLGLLEIKEEE
ncbi:helix-turn-helix domain-containing protein [Paenibacillus sp. FSL H8-0457]|uniref:TetR/AcrR family transcriptional regulator n=1 Tax=Bacillales TaxID=1385 RepID=UPI0003E2B207|nr:MULTISPECIES: TetR/AcrR family transcriptional regulator [Paenibacillus]ETT68108.1 TetR family transcriptional regulator [Paenibacillus sp. FSL H8-457]MCM3259361.1 TetR/AcrR family transcriptional regulator [Paenibacillus lautus]